VRRDGTVHLSIPARATVAAAEQFIRDHEEWVLEALARMEKRSEAHPLGESVGDSLPYMGGRLEVVWKAGSPARVEANMDEGRLTVTLPDPTDTELRAAAIETFEKAETKKLVTALVKRYHPIFATRGVPYPKAIRVKVMTTRHGSCSSAKGYLNFSSRLCQYPLPFVEYVVVHELCHFLEANHSDRFWREVARVLPDWEARERLGKN
jgi:predicted metal-dependent hydrolase